MIRILAADGMEKGAVKALEEKGCEVVQQFYEVEDLKQAVKEFDALVVRSATKVRVPVIDEAAAAGRLKIIIRGGVGVDNIDVDYAKEKGIEVRNTPRASSQSVAELAMGHMFACARFLSVAGHSMREGKWEKKAYAKGIELQGRTLGIIGFGRIGQHLGGHAAGRKRLYQRPCSCRRRRRHHQCRNHCQDEGRRLHHQHQPGRQSG